MSGFHSAKEIYAELLRQGETVGLTTVYRHLEVLSEQRADGFRVTVLDSVNELALTGRKGS